MGWSFRIPAASLNESPSEKEGKFPAGAAASEAPSLNESPSEKEGKFNTSAWGTRPIAFPQ